MESFWALKASNLASGTTTSNIHTFCPSPFYVKKVHHIRPNLLTIHLASKKYLLPNTAQLEISTQLEIFEDLTDKLGHRVALFLALIPPTQPELMFENVMI